MASKKLNTDGVEKRLNRFSTASKQAIDHEKSEVIPLEDIELNKSNYFNKYDTEEDIDRLVASIEENGLIHPINVMKKGDRYLLISGERRLKAYKKMGRPGIRATIVFGLSEVEIIKRTFFGNTEVRDLTLEQKLEIISAFKAELDALYENGKYDVSELKKDISQAFNIKARQTDKLVTINERLIEEFINLICQERLDIDSGARYASLPENSQRFILDFFTEDVLSNPKQLGTLKEILYEFVSKVKTIKTKEKSHERKILTTISYNEKNMEINAKEAAKIEEELTLVNEDEGESLSIPVLQEKKTRLEKNIDKSRKQLAAAKDELQLLEKKTNAEIEALQTSFETIVNQKLSNDEIDEPDQQDRKQKVKKEIKTIERAIKKLNELLPADELSEVLQIIESYKTNISDSDTIRIIKKNYKKEL